MNYLTPKTRKEVLDLLVNGLKRLEYRGYDSAGLAIDSNDGRDIVLVKRTGKVQILQDAITDGMCWARRSLVHVWPLFCNSNDRK